jgi:ribosomal protein L21
LTVYKSFPQANLIREWDKLLKLSKDEVVALYEQWKEIHKENEEKYRKLNAEKFEKIHEVSDFLKSKGIDVYKYKTRSIFKEKNGYQAWFSKNIVDVISRKYPYYHNSIPTAHMTNVEVDGVNLYNNSSPTNLVELYDRITWQYNSKIKEVKKVDKLLVKSIEYATKYNIDIDDLQHKDIIDIVSEHAKEEYLKENVPTGSEVYLKHECYECSTYMMGEHRCSCGNRRIYVTVEGDLIEGFYHYPEAH